MSWMLFLISIFLYSANLIVRTNQGETKVFLDNNFIGITDNKGILIIKDIPEEEHFLKVKKKGFHSQSKKVVVDKDYLIVDFELKPVFKKNKVVIINTEVPDCKVYLNSKYLGTTDHNGILKIKVKPTEKGILKVEKPHYYVVFLKLDRSSIEEGIINVKLKKIPQVKPVKYTSGQSNIFYVKLIILIIAALLVILIVILLVDRARAKKLEKRIIEKTPAFYNNTPSQPGIKKSTFQIKTEIGRKIGNRYLIKDIISKGGMGIIYLAYDLMMQRDVALKIILPELARKEEAVKRFIHEVRLTSKLVHPNIIILHNFGKTEDNILFIVMEYIRGDSLSKILKENLFLTPNRTITIAAQIASALEEAHRKGIIHRDLKPSNVMVFTKGNMQDFVKVLDFGIAKSLQQPEWEFTQKGMIIGTPAYMAPEQILGKEVDHRTDIYSLAVLVCKMLTGERPYKPYTSEGILKVFVQNIPPRINLKEEFSKTKEVLLKGLAREKEKRYNSAKEFVYELARSLNIEIKIPWF